MGGRYRILPRRVQKKMKSPDQKRVIPFIEVLKITMIIFVCWVIGSK